MPQAIQDLLEMIELIIKTDLLVIAIIILSYVVEKYTRLRLLVAHFKWEKSPHNARIAADGHAVYFFFFALVIFIYAMVKGFYRFTALGTIVWLIAMISTAVWIRKIYFKHQGVDKSKADDEFS